MYTEYSVNPATPLHQYIVKYHVEFAIPQIHFYCGKHVAFYENLDTSDLESHIVGTFFFYQFLPLCQH